jgi:hypothetical protein
MRPSRIREVLVLIFRFACPPLDVDEDTSDDGGPISGITVSGKAWPALSPACTDEPRESALLCRPLSGDLAPETLSPNDFASVSYVHGNQFQSKFDPFGKTACTVSRNSCVNGYCRASTVCSATVVTVVAVVVVQR